MKRKIRAVFLDRDGVINRDPGSLLFVKNWSSFSFLPGVFEALRILRQADFKIFVVSNQSGVARGNLGLEELEALTARMVRALKQKGIRLAGVFYCPHRDEDQCACRKPKAGLYRRALGSRLLDLGRSFNIGDTERDIRAGKKLGLTSILVLSGKTKNPKAAEKFGTRPDYIAVDLKKAALWIVRQKES